jgi:hypothetical protein
MIDRVTFQQDPREYAAALVEEGMVDGGNMFAWLLEWCSQDDIRRFLEVNQLSPDFWFCDDEDPVEEDD